MARGKMSQDGGEKSQEGKIIVVGLDKTNRELLELDKQGANLQFDPSGFPELSEDEVRDLSYGNKQVYLLALQALRVARHAQDVNVDIQSEGEPLSRRLRILGGSATNKLKRPEDLEVGMHWAPKRPDEVDEAEKEGYVRMGTLTSMNGEAELVGMAIPEERYQEHLRAVGELSRERASAARAATVEKLTTGPFTAEDQTTKNRVTRS